MAAKSGAAPSQWRLCVQTKGVGNCAYLHLSIAAALSLSFHLAHNWLRRKVATVCVVSRRKSLENFRFRLEERIVLDFISHWRINSTSLSRKLQFTFDAFSNGILLLAGQFYLLLDEWILVILFQLPLATKLIFHTNSGIFKIIPVGCFIALNYRIHCFHWKTTSCTRSFC